MLALIKRDKPALTMTWKAKLLNAEQKFRGCVSFNSTV